MNAIAIAMDTGRAEAALALAARLLASAPPEAADRLLQALEGDELRLFDIHAPAAAGAHEVVVRFQPTEFLLGLLAAAGASEGELGMIKGSHQESSILCVATPMVGQPGRTRNGPAGAGAAP